MNGSERKTLKAALFATLRDQLNGEGFKLKAARDTFVRAHEGYSERFMLVCLDGKPGWRIQPNVGIRIERVEEIFHKTSGFEPKYQKDTPTIGGAVGNIEEGDNRDLPCFFGPALA